MKAVVGHCWRYASHFMLFASLVVLSAPAWAADVDVLISEFIDTPDPAVRGGDISYRIEIANNSVNTAGDVTLSVPIPANTLFQSVTTTDGACNHSGGPGTLNCSLGLLAPTDENPMTTERDPALVNLVIRTTGATGATLDITGTVDPVGDTDTNPFNNQGGQTTTIDDGADLTVTKVDDPDPVVAAGQLEYTLTVENRGPNDADSLAVTDTLPPNVDFVSANGAGWACSHLAGEVTCTLGSLADGDTASPVTIATRVTGSQLGTITNQVEIGSGTGDPLPDNNVTTEDTTVTEGTDLAVTKSIVPNPPVAGDLAIYTLSPRNLGPFDAANVSVTDVLPAGVSFQSAAAPAGWSCSESGGTLTCNHADYRVGAGDDIEITVLLDSLLSGNISNTANVSAATNDPVPANNSDTLNVAVVPDGADLALTKSKSPNPVAQGSDITSTIRVANNGPRATTGTITMTDLLSTGETYVSAAGSNWTCGHNGVNPGGIVTCNYDPAGLANGASAPAITVVTTATNSGTLTNNADVVDVGGQPDGVPGNNSGSASVTSTAARADLQVTKTAAPDPLTVNDATLTYTVTLRNAGPDVAGNITLTDRIPGYVAGQTPVSVTALSDPNFSCTAGQTVSCTSNGPYQLAAGADAVFTIEVGRPLRDGSFTNRASAYSSLVGDPVRGNNTGSDTIVIQPVTDLAVTAKTVNPNPVEAGVQATYVITLQNLGPSTATDVTLDDVFSVPAGRDFSLVSATPTKGACAPFVEATETLSCAIGNLADGETQTLTVVVRPDWDSGDDAWSLGNTAAAATGTHETNLTNNARSATVDIVRADLDLLVNKSDLVDPIGYDPADSNIITYRVRVRNQGPSLATGVMLTDTMAPKNGKTLRFLCDKSGSGDDCAAVSALALCNQLGTDVTGPGTLDISCALPDITAGTNYIRYLDFEVVSDPDPTGDTHLNSARVETNETDRLSSNDQDGETTTVRQRVDLAVTKAADTDPVPIMQPFNWMVRVTNNGPGNSLVTDLQDSLPAGMEFHGATPSWSGSDPVAGGDCTVTVSDLDCDFGAVNNAGLVTVTIPVRATLAGSLSNCASAGTDQVDPDSTNNQDICGSVTVQNTVTGRVYEDVDGDGVYTAGTDVPQTGATVNISDSGGNPHSVTTDGDGLFSQVVPPGPTLVDVDETTLTTVNPTLTSDDNGEGSDATIVVVPPTGTANDNTGYLANAQNQSVFGKVYHDLDGSGTFAPGDLVQAGVGVTVTDANGGLYNLVTDVNGDFSAMVAAGEATVDVDQTGLAILNPSLTTNDAGEGSDSTSVTVPAGGSAGDNTGYVSNAQSQAVVGRVYEDVDGSGSFTPGDAPQSAVAVQVTDASGGVYNLITDVNGDFSAAVAAGDAVVDVDESGLALSNPTLTTDASGEGSDPTLVTVPAGGSARDNTGYVQDAQTQTLTGRVYEDRNRNGTFGSGDIPQAGATVVVTDAVGGVYILVTDAAGIFGASVAAGDARVDVDETTLSIADPILTTDAHGEGSDPTLVTVPVGGTASDNTGYRSSTAFGGDRQTLTGKIYQDVDGSGTYSAGDIPQAGAGVRVTDAIGGVYILSTDAAGDFSVFLAAGDATVDVDESSLSIVNPTLTDNTSGEGSDPTLVAVPVGGTANDNTGYVSNAMAQHVTGTVYSDVNGNGVYDPTEDSTLAGVRVVVTDSNGGVHALITDANGVYFSLVPAGSTLVDVDEATLPRRSSLTVGNSDPTTVGVPLGGSTTEDRGYLVPALPVGDGPRAIPTLPQYGLVLLSLLLAGLGARAAKQRG